MAETTYIIDNNCTDQECKDIASGENLDTDKFTAGKLVIKGDGGKVFILEVNSLGNPNFREL